MKQFLSFGLVIGVLIAGWMYRDKVGGVFANAGPSLEKATSKLGLQRGANATPNPAREAQAQALSLYPGLARPDSELNKQFRGFYKQAQASNPALLSQPDWPLQLAERAVVSLGAAPMPRSMARTAPAGVQAAPRKDVVVYTTSHCPYCVKAKEYLTQKGVRYREIDIERSIIGKEAYRKLGGNGVPLIMVGDTKVEGFNPSRLDRLL
jgi:glutaredoxin